MAAAIMASRPSCCLPGSSIWTPCCPVQRIGPAKRSDASATRRFSSSQPKVTRKVTSPSSRRVPSVVVNILAVARFAEPQPICVQRDEGRQTEEEQRGQGEDGESSDARHGGHLVEGAPGWRTDSLYREPSTVQSTFFAGLRAVRAYARACEPPTHGLGEPSGACR